MEEQILPIRDSTTRLTDAAELLDMAVEENDEAELADVEAEPVEDPAANDVATETPDLSPSETAQIQEAGDNAADTAAAAMDAMSQDASN